MCVGRVELHRSLFCGCRSLALKRKAEISAGWSSICATDPRSMWGLWLRSRWGEHLLLTRCHCGLLFSLCAYSSWGVFWSVLFQVSIHSSAACFLKCSRMMPHSMVLAISYENVFFCLARSIGKQGGKKPSLWNCWFFYPSPNFASVLLFDLQIFLVEYNT